MKKAFLSLLLSLLITCSWAQQSQNITFTHEGKTVYGTFTSPAGSGRFPTIIIMPGSGANDRNGTITMVGGNAQCLYPNLLNQTLRPYQDLANALTDSGYAVLRYDKIEYTYTSSAALGPVTFEKLWLPVESALDYVKTRPDVDTNRLILIGHSEGSTFIPYIARKRNDVKALISLAGARMPFDSLLAEQLPKFARLCNGNVTQAQQDSAQITLYFNYVRSGNTSMLPTFAGVPAAEWKKYIHINDSVSINYNLSNLPTLFVGMQQDLNVPPRELQRFQQEITNGADFYSMPGLNHYLTTNSNPAVAIALTDTIIYWLRQQQVLTNVKPQLTRQQVSIHYSASGFTVQTDAAVQQINVYDVSGRKIKEIEAPLKSVVHVDRKELVQGVVLFEIITQKGVVVKKVFNL